MPRLNPNLTLPRTLIRTPKIQGRRQPEFQSSCAVMVSILKHPTPTIELLYVSNSLVIPWTIWSAGH